MSPRLALLRRILGAGLRFAAGWTIVAAFLFPIWWLITTSLKTRVDAFKIPPDLIFRPTFESYAAILSDHDFMGFYLNSLIVASATTLIALLLGTPAAYALARYRFRGRRDLAFWLLSTRMAPPIAIILPFYLMFMHAGMLDTRMALIIPNVVANTGLVVWLLRSFFREVPRSIEEAALIDGCGPWRAFFLVALPAASNGLVAAGIICFVFAWNEYLFSLLITGQATRTATVAITNFVTFQGINWGRLAAASVLVMLPVFVLAMIAQRWIVRGFTMGAVK